MPSGPASAAEAPSRGLAGAGPVWMEQAMSDILPPTPHPVFTAGELRRAFDALDTVFQNDEPLEQEREINEGKLTERLQQQGITLVLAKALIDQLLAAGVFREADPNQFFIEIRQLNYLDGRTVDNGSRMWRALSMSRDRWYAYRTERLREDNKAEDEAARKEICPTLRLRVEGNQIFLDGSPVQADLTPEKLAQALCFLRHLLEAAGNWLSSGDIDQAESKKEYKGMSGTRWDRVRKALPPCIYKLTGSDRRKGYRLLPAAWRK